MKITSTDTSCETTSRWGSLTRLKVGLRLKNPTDIFACFYYFTANYSDFTLLLAIFQSILKSLAPIMCQRATSIIWQRLETCLSYIIRHSEHHVLIYFGQMLSLHFNAESTDSWKTAVKLLNSVRNTGIIVPRRCLKLQTLI